MSGNQKLKITKEKRGSATIVRLVGEVDLFHSRDLKQLFSQLMNQGVKALVVNLKEVGYIDSSGIGVLLFLFSESRKRSIPLFLSEIHGDVKKVIELTKLQDYLPIVHSDSEAIARL